MIDPTRIQTERALPPRIERSYHDPQRGYRGYVVVDSLVGGHAHGGIRIRPGLTLDELRAAARVMSWKHRFVGVPNGGAKAGVEGPENLSRKEKARRLAWLAEQASDLIDGRIYGISPDMGTDSGLIDELLRQRGLLGRQRPFPARFRGSGYYTALTAVEAAEAGLAIEGRSLGGLRVAIEGFGAVGSHAARIARARGATVIGISTSAGMITRAEGLDLDGLLAASDPLAGDPRAQRGASPELLELDVDVLLPCGPGDTIDLAAARAIRARVVSPGANAALTWRAEATLHAQGTLVIPSFVANCGGIAAASLRVGGVPEWAIERLLVRHYRSRVVELIEDARREGLSPVEVALARLLLPRTTDGQAAAPSVLAWARRFYRARRVPGLLLALPTYLYFARRLGALASSPR